MTTETKVEDKKTTKAAADKAAADSQPILTTAVVIKLGKSKKKKRKYTKGTKGLQRFLLGVDKAIYRTANSFAKGNRTISRRSNRSARKKRDGFIRDSLRNVSRGVQDGFNELGKAPDEIAKRIGTRQFVRAFRVFTPFSN